MSRSNYDKPFYVDIGTSVAAIRCASNHDVVDSLDHNESKYAISIVERTCERMNKEFELYAKLIYECLPRVAERAKQLHDAELDDLMNLMHLYDDEESEMKE